MTAATANAATKHVEDFSVRVTALAQDGVRELRLPPPAEFAMEGIRWGRFDTPFTAAFWRAQVWFREVERSAATGATRASALHSPYALGHTLAEEIAACLLGGYGMPAELGLAAFIRLRDSNLLLQNTTETALFERRLFEALSEPFGPADRPRRYRFPKQRARHLAAALQSLPALVLDGEHPQTFRNSLCGLPGIGFKTASWVTRNFLGCDAVAILDVHVLRAGKLVGLFPDSARIDRDYFLLEQRFLAFSAALEVSAAELDAVIWQEMRGFGQVPRRQLKNGAPFPRRRPRSTS